MDDKQLEDGERHVIDESVPLKPSFQRTWPVVLFNHLLSFSGVSGRGRTGANSAPESEEVEQGEETSGLSSEAEANGKVTKMPMNAAPAVKAGGRRRKGGKR
jgi:hypothetical protein